MYTLYAFVLIIKYVFGAVCWLKYMCSYFMHYFAYSCILMIMHYQYKQKSALPSYTCTLIIILYLHAGIPALQKGSCS